MVIPHKKVSSSTRLSRSLKAIKSTSRGYLKFLITVVHISWFKIVSSTTKSSKETARVSRFTAILTCLIHTQSSHRVLDTRWKDLESLLTQLLVQKKSHLKSFNWIWITSWNSVNSYYKVFVDICKWRLMIWIGRECYSVSIFQLIITLVLKKFQNLKQNQLKRKKAKVTREASVQIQVPIQFVSAPIL